MKNEICFKQWHDDDLAKFHKEILPGFGQCDVNSNVTLADLLLITSDAAVEDFNQRGMSQKSLIEKGFGILASRMSFHIYKMPVERQKFVINTWEEKPAGLLLTRRYELCDAETNEVLISGLSLWTVIDFEKRRIIPPKMFTVRKEPEFTTEYNGIAPGRIAVPENLEVIGSHKVVFSDLDANGHTNNSRYANFIVDCLPAEYQNKVCKDFRINYSKEALLGEEITVYANFNKDENRIVVVGKSGDATCFEGELIY